MADGVSSRTQTDRKLAINNMENLGTFVSTIESIVLALVGDASDPNFKSIQKLIKELSPDTGLF